MKYQNKLLIVFWGCLLFVSVSCEAQNLPPELLILQQVTDYQKAGKTKHELELLLQATQFLNDIQAVKNLLNFFQQTKEPDGELAVNIVLLYMTCHPERMIIERLRGEQDVWKKVGLMGLLMDFYTEESFLTLIDQLDDMRTVVIPAEMYAEPIADHVYERVDRVCDRAYHLLISKLFALGRSEYQAFEPPPFPSIDEMNGLIAQFKQYWEKYRIVILEKLSEREPETIVDAVFQK